MESTTCNTCTNRIDQPYRVYDAQGKVIQGCVDACHIGQIVTPSESSRWLMRPEAKKIRIGLRKMLQGK